MNRKFLIRLAPLLAIAAIAVVPAAAQGASYFKSGVKIPVGETVPTLSWGTLTLTPNPPVAPVTTCENVVGGFVKNVETEPEVFVGAGQTSNFATYNCVNAGCPAGKVKIGEGEFEKEFVVAATKLPWPSTLIEEAGIRVNSTGVQVSLGCVAHGLSNTSPPGGTKIGSGTEKEQGAQEQFYLAAPTICVTTETKQQKPIAENGKNTTVTSKVSFDAGAGALSCAGGAVEGKTSGKLKLVAYHEQEVITSK